MCGISCVITLKGHGPNPQKYGVKTLKEACSIERAHLSTQMEQSLETIKHRGPDDRGYWFGEHNRVVLGHVRLSIIDTSPDGNQPFHSQDDTVHAVVSGEFYDFEEIRAGLEQKGYKFSSRCDSEILVALYQEYGMSMMDHLRGEFAFVLYDSKTQYVVAARDRFGVKPLFYTIQDGRLLIASEMKAFLAFGWQPEWDVQALMETAYMSDTRTIFADVQKILPGRYMSVSSFNAIAHTEYWDIDYSSKHEVETRSDEELIEGVRQRLLDAVRVRLRADVPVGIFLSGGLDSSTVAGMVKHLMVEKGVHLGNEESATARINCYSIKFMDDEFDEEPIAQRTAEWLGVKKHVVRMTEEEFVNNYSDAAWYTEVPVVDLNFIGKVALSKLTRETGVKVILTGEGSDEQFAGYGQLLADFLRDPDTAYNSRTLTEEARKKYLYNEENAGTSDQKSIKNFRPSDPPSAFYARSQVNNVNIVSLLAFMNPATLLAPWARAEHGDQDPRSIAVHNGVNGTVRRKMQLEWHSLHTSLYIWQKTFLANMLLTALGDRVEMSHSIEGRQPFLDHHLTEYVQRIPPSMKFRYDPVTGDFSEKWILKEAAKPFITEELYNRRKHPFSAPTTYKVDGPLHRYFAGLVTQHNVEQLGFLDWEKCKTLVNESFVKQNAVQMRQLFMVTQLIEMSKRFGVKKAVPEYAVEERNGFLPLVESRL